MTISEETLMAYADGELDAATRASVEAAMQQDPDIGKRVARHRALREKMQGAFSAVLQEQVPDRLIQAARGHPAKPPTETAARQGTVMDLSVARVAAQRKNLAVPLRWQPAAIAASLLLGLGLGFLAWHEPNTLIRPGAGGGLVAGAALAEALSIQLSDDRPANQIAYDGVELSRQIRRLLQNVFLEGSRGKLGSGVP